MPIPMQVLHHRRVRERGGGGEDGRLRGEACKREGGREDVRGGRFCVSGRHFFLLATVANGY